MLCEVSPRRGRSPLVRTVASEDGGKQKLGKTVGLALTNEMGLGPGDPGKRFGILGPLPRGLVRRL